MLELCDLYQYTFTINNPEAGQCTFRVDKNIDRTYRILSLSKIKELSFPETSRAFRGTYRHILDYTSRLKIDGEIAGYVLNYGDSYITIELYSFLCNKWINRIEQDIKMK